MVLESCRKADEIERKDPVAIQRTTDQMSLRETWPCFILYYLSIDNSSSYSLVAWVVGFWYKDRTCSGVPRTENLVSSEGAKTLDPPCDR
jgi:hypothetical protein